VVARLGTNDCGEASLVMFAADHPDQARLRPELTSFGTSVITLADE